MTLPTADLEHTIATLWRQDSVDTFEMCRIPTVDEDVATRVIRSHLRLRLLETVEMWCNRVIEDFGTLFSQRNMGNRRVCRCEQRLGVGVGGLG